jgi:hypothetical protein
VPGPEQRNCEEIFRLDHLLVELRADRSSARGTGAIRETGLEVAIAVREVGAMLVVVGLDQSHATQTSPPASPGPSRSGPR